MSGLAVKEKEYKMIRVDADTHARLRTMAAGKTISGYLRQISNGYEAKEQVEARLEKKIEKIEFTLTELKGLIGEAHRVNKHGKLVRVKDMREPDGSFIPIFQASMIQEALEENPKVTEVGWYRKVSNGVWEFKQKEFDEWYEGPYTQDRDAISAALEAMNDDPSSIIKETHNTDDWMAETARVREELIKYGRKLIEKQKAVKK